MGTLRNTSGYKINKGVQSDKHTKICLNKFKNMSYDEFLFFCKYIKKYLIKMFKYHK